MLSDGPIRPNTPRRVETPPSILKIPIRQMNLVPVRWCMGEIASVAAERMPMNGSCRLDGFSVRIAHSRRTRNESSLREDAGRTEKKHQHQCQTDDDDTGGGGRSLE